MRNVIQLANLSDLYDRETGSLCFSVATPEDARQLLNIVLAMAVGDHAASVHYHAYPVGTEIDNELAYIVGGIRYYLVPPPHEIASALIAAARTLLAPRGLRGWLRRLIARAVGSCSGQFSLVAADGCRSEWCGAVWSTGQIRGLEFYRVDLLGAMFDLRAVGRDSASIAEPLRGQ